MLALNKEDLITEYIAQKKADGKEVSTRQASDDVDTALASIMSVLAKGKDEAPNSKGVRVRLQIVNFGKFEVKERKERIYRNPQNGETTEPKPAHNVATFSDGKAFSEFIN